MTNRLSLKLLIIAALLMPLGARAATVSDTYTHSTRFWRNSVAADFDLGYQFSLGVEGDVLEHDDFARHVYILRAPLTWRTTIFDVTLKPFWSPDNANGSSFHGGRAAFSFVTDQNDVENSTTRTYVSVGYGAQKADVYKTSSAETDASYRQLAYEGGLILNSSDIYIITMSANIFQYLDGISDVQSVKTTMSQEELADLGSIDYTLGLPRGSAGIKMGWNSRESRSSNFISYRYVDMYNEPHFHTVMASSTVALNGWFALNITYNHIFMKEQSDRDIISGGVIFNF